MRNFGIRSTPPARTRATASSAASSPQVSGISAKHATPGSARATSTSRASPGCGSSPRLATATSIWRNRARSGSARAAPGSASIPVSPTIPTSRSRSTVPATSPEASSPEATADAGSSSGPTRSAYHAARCPWCAAIASGSGALPGGNTAASSTRRASSAGTRVAMATELSGSYN